MISRGVMIGLKFCSIIIAEDDFLNLRHANLA